MSEDGSLSRTFVLADRVFREFAEMTAAKAVRVSTILTPDRPGGATRRERLRLCVAAEAFARDREAGGKLIGAGCRVRA
jgi:hypothetical protein